MKIAISIFFFFLSAGYVHAQTRRIAHRSHSTSKIYRHNESKDNYGIPMHTLPQASMYRAPHAISAVTWVSDTVNGIVTWRLDTMRTPGYTPSKSVSYHHLIISDVSQLGHVCAKVTRSK